MQMAAHTSGVILAGGESSRMGRSKAELDLHGVSFLEHQVNKLRNIGIRDIVIAGYPASIEDVRSVTDVYPRRGPLGGIHAGLLAIKEPRALVLAVDTPLLPPELLQQLIDSHKSDITVVSCSGALEPLIGVYSKSLCPACEEILRGERTAIRRLYDTVGFAVVEYTGDPTLLMNCNTPEDYERICSRDSV